jgi:heat shock protein HslJ
MLLERNPAGLPPQPRDPWEGTPVLAGTSWVLSSLDGAWNDAAARGRVLTFDADRWTLTSPCGPRTGPWRQEGQRVIAEAPAPASAPSCAPEAAAADARLLAMLDADPRFVTGPNGEILLGGGGHWAAGEGPRPRLLSDVPLGGTFSIVEVDGAAPAGAPQIEFRPSDYSGSNGCNGLQGLFLAHSGRFFSDPPIQTQRACGGKISAQERRISSLLSGGPRVAFAGNGDIFLVDQAGSLRLRRETAAGSSPPVGRLWRGEPLEVELIRLDGKPLQARYSDPETRLRLSAQRFDIEGACGRFGGIWRIRAGELKFLTDAEPPPTGACALAERLTTFSRLFNGRARTLVGPSNEFILAGEGHWLTGRIVRPSAKRR